MEMQGWLLRRCLSVVSRICQRPHRPRDAEIRKICKVAGVTWPDPVKVEHPSDDEMDFQEEAPESDLEYTDDEEVPADFEADPGTTTLFITRTGF